MSEPKTIREVNYVVQGVKEALDGRITLLQMGVGACLTIIIAVAGGGFALHKEIASVDSKLSALQASINERTSKLSAEIAALPNNQKQLQEALARIEARLPAPTPPIQLVGMQLTPEETRVLRDFFRAFGVGKGGPYKLGDKIPDEALSSTPDEIVARIAKLKGTKVVVDSTGSIVLTAGLSNQVIAIIPPSA
jgi:hypothetical protein